MMTDGYDKIRVKGSVHQFKRGPAPTGAARLQQRVNRLLLDAARLARRENAYAARLRELLHAFLAEAENTRSGECTGTDGAASPVRCHMSSQFQPRGPHDESHD